MNKTDTTHQAVQEYYGKIARKGSSCCSTPGGEVPRNLYPLEMLKELPADIVNSTNGSGDPVTLANLQPGETVLDLGSGTGLDCLLAARRVGAQGHVIGVDMTADMLAAARTNAAREKAGNVEFREGLLEALPVDDSSVDVIISNCVINLSPQKEQVFSEMFRVLRPGGRIAISDMVTNRAFTEQERNDSKNWCSCTSGALPRAEFRSHLEKAGFTSISIEPDIETIIKEIDSGLVKSPQGTTIQQAKDKALTGLKDWENASHTMVAPHKITARKPV